MDLFLQYETDAQYKSQNDIQENMPERSIISGGTRRHTKCMCPFFRSLR